MIYSPSLVVIEGKGSIRAMMLDAAETDEVIRAIEEGHYNGLKAKDAALLYRLKEARKSLENKGGTGQEEETEGTESP